MNPSEIDYGAFALLVGRWIVVFLVLYLIVIIGLRISKYYKLAQCPNCGGELKRSQRKGQDKMINNFSFGILPVKRYRCYTCYWEGLSLNIPKERKIEEVANNDKG